MKKNDLEEIKNQVAVKHGYKDWNMIMEIYNFPVPNKTNERYSKDCEVLNLYVTEAMQEYAKQCCYEQIKACGKSFIEGLTTDNTYDLIMFTPNITRT